MGGKVWVDSEGLGHGTKIIITLTAFANLNSDEDLKIL